MRLLVAAENFRQGWGGVPESIRLMACQLAPHGVTIDVFERGRLYGDVGDLALLPEGALTGEPFSYDGGIGAYDAILQVGPWQSAAHLRRLHAKRSKGQPLYYLPRGGLARVEFQRARDMKKWPYLLLIERRFIAASNGVIFSSELEKLETVAPARDLSAEVIIPDFVASSPQAPAEDRTASGKLTFGFLGEIAPRKGLLPLVEAFRDFAVTNGLVDRVLLRVGGAARQGSEAYLRAANAAVGESGVQVEFLGPVRHADRAAFYGSLDALVVASRFESYGLTPLEALGAGCAIVVAPRVGFLEYLPASPHAIRTRGADVTSLSAALAQAHAQISQGPSGARAERSAFAAHVTKAINAQALSAWTARLP